MFQRVHPEELSELSCYQCEGIEHYVRDCQLTTRKQDNVTAKGKERRAERQVGLVNKEYEQSEEDEPEEDHLEIDQQDCNDNEI